MESKKHLVWVAGVLALIAAWTSGSLLLLHAEKDADLGLLAAICSATEDGCASVVNSRWGVLPPGEKGSDGPHDGFPVAALGFLYYALLASWYLLIGIPDPGRMWLSRMVLYLNALGVVGSIIYTALIFFAIGTACYLCLLTHACNMGIFIVSWLLRPRQKQPRGVGSPSNRLLAASAATLLLACGREDADAPDVATPRTKNLSSGSATSRHSGITSDLSKSSVRDSQAWKSPGMDVPMPFTPPRCISQA
jgi:uncharacterized membrane protein